MKHTGIYGFMSFYVYRQNHAKFKRLVTAKQFLEVWIALASINEMICYRKHRKSI